MKFSQNEPAHINLNQDTGLGVSNQITVPDLNPERQAVASSVLEAIERETGGKIENPELLNDGDYLVLTWSMDGEKYVSRSYPPEVDDSRIVQEVAMTKQLLADDFPCCEPADKLLPGAVIVAGDLITSVWNHIPKNGHQLDYRGFGHLLKTFHFLAKYYSEKPYKDDNVLDELMEKFTDRLSELPVTRKEELISYASKLKDGLEKFWEDSPLGFGIVHGHVHDGNVISTNSGPVMADFRMTTIAPREYDLACYDVCMRRFNQPSPEDFQEFCFGYGTVPPGTKEYEQLEKFHELQMLSRLMKVSPGQPEALKELEYRVDTILDNDVKARWNPC